MNPKPPRKHTEKAEKAQLRFQIESWKLPSRQEQGKAWLLWLILGEHISEQAKP